jgi:hypothetical protein
MPEGRNEKDLPSPILLRLTHGGNLKLMPLAQSILVNCLYVCLHTNARFLELSPSWVLILLLLAV